MTPVNPYLIRAFHEWIVSNDMTPMIHVNANYPGAESVLQFADDKGVVAFNLSYQATKKLDLGDEWISFMTRIQGVPQEIILPVGSVVWITSRETTAGTALPIIEEQHQQIKEFAEKKTKTDNKDSEEKKPERKKPTLTIVK